MSAVAKDIMTRSNTIAHRYLKRTSLYKPDYAAAATLAQVAALAGFDPTKGDWRAYSATVAARAIRDEMRLGYPVSGPKRKKSEQNPLRNVKAHPLDAEGARPIARAASQHDDLIRAEVRRRITEILGSNGAKFALAVISGELRPAEFAAETGIDVHEVCLAQRRVCKRLSEDELLRKLWEETA